MRRRLLLLLMLGLTVLGGCSRKPDEQRIRDTVAAMQNALEASDPHAFMAHITKDFTGNDGSVDHDGLANIMRAMVLSNDKVGVTLGPLETKMMGERATLHVIATFTGGRGLIPEHGAIYAIDSGWRREGSEWVCYYGKWEQEL